MKRKSISEIAKSTLKNKDGAALVTVLVIFLTLVVIVTAASQAALANFMRAKKTSDHSSVIYLAEAGLYKYHDSFSTYLSDMITLAEESKSDFVVDDLLVEKFLESINSELDNNDVYDDSEKLIKISFGKIMNELGSAQVTIQYRPDKDINEGDKVLRYIELKSTGALGSAHRTVRSEFEIDMINLVVLEANVLQPGGTTAIDTSENPVDFYFPPLANRDYSLDSVVTNQKVVMPLSGALGKLKGPLVTNNIIDFNRGYEANWQDGMIISSSIINIGSNLQKLNAQAIIFKPKKVVVSGNEEVGYEYEYDYSNTYIDMPKSNSFMIPGIKYIYIPEKGNANDYFRQEGVPSEAVMTRFLSKGTQIVYYDPFGFNPYVDNSTPAISASDKIAFFGKDPETIKEGEKRPKLDFKQYFSEEFVLDNLHRDSIVKRHKPTVKLPDKAQYTDLYTSLKKTPSIKEHNVQIIDDNNNLNLSNNALVNNKYILDLGAYSKAFGSKTIAFNSITLGGGYGVDSPMRIRVGDEKVTLVTKKLDFTGNIELIADKGSLEIVVIGENNLINQSHFRMQYNNLRIVNSQNVISKKPSQFRFVVYETSPELTITSSSNGKNFTFAGTIFSENLSINIKTGYDGNFISAKGKKVVFPNVGQTAGSQLIYAPQATLTLEGGEIRGVVIVNEYKFGRAQPIIIFESDFMVSFLEELDNPIFDTDDLGMGGGTVIIKGDAQGGAVIEVVE